MDDIYNVDPFGENCLAAVTYGKMGYSVLPLKKGGKVPLVYDWTHLASKDICDIKAWWTKYEGANIGIACGSLSNNLIIVDVDNHDGVDGLGNLKAWESIHGALPTTVTTRSGSGGLHKWYLLPNDSVKILNKVNLLKGVDIRGEGGQVCVPPSTHPNGTPYVFIDGDGNDLDIETGISNLSNIAYADETVMALIGEAEEAQAPNWDGVLSDPSSKFVFYNEPTVVPKGGRDIALFQKIASLIGKGLPQNEVEYYAQDFNTRVLSPPLSAREVSSKVSNRCRSYAPGHSAECEAAIQKRAATTSAIKKTTCFSEEADDVDTVELVNPEDAGFSLEGTRNLITYEVEKNGKIVPQVDYTARTGVTICENYNILKGLLCYNDFKDCIWLRGVLPWETTGEKVDRQYSNVDSINLIALIEDEFGFYKIQRLEDAIAITAERKHVNPVAEWMEAMPKWDGVKRLDTLLTDLLGVEDNIYTRETAALIFYGMIRRTYEPGCKFDYTPVLVGPQGCGKSTFCRLLTLEHSNWFKDDLRSFEGPEPARAIPGHLVIEIAELAAMKSTKKQELIKSFITSQSDSNRKMRQDIVTETPRRCIFIGTTNTEDFLVDPTGNRRFLPLATNADNRGWDKPLYEYSNEYLLSYITQVWSEALSRYTPETSLVLSKEAGRLAFDEQAAHLEVDSRVDVIREWLDIHKPAVGALTYAYEVCEDALELETSYLNTDRGAVELKKIGMLLQNSIEGWRRVGRRSVNGHKRQAYQRTEQPEGQL